MRIENVFYRALWNEAKIFSEKTGRKFVVKPDGERLGGKILATVSATSDVGEFPGIRIVGSIVRAKENKGACLAFRVEIAGISAYAYPDDFENEIGKIAETLGVDSEFLHEKVTAAAKSVKEIVREACVETSKLFPELECA